MEYKNIYHPSYEKNTFQRIKELKEAKGLSYSEIAKVLANEGYVGSEESKITQPMISRFMIERGYRILELRGRVKYVPLKPRPAPTVTLAKTDRNFQADIKLALESHFSKQGQAVVLEALVEAYKKQAGI